MTSSSTTERPRVAVVPLDDRPVSTVLVTRIAELAGVEVALAPSELLGDRDGVRERDELEDWLEHAADSADILLVSLNQLLYGGFVASRRTWRSTAESTTALGILAQIRQRHPGIRIEASLTLMRTKDRNDAGAEPDYWAEYGVALAADSAEVYRQEHAAGSGGEPAPFALRSAAVPREHLEDVYLRRLRLHVAQLAAIEAVEAGVIDRLTILVEDSRVESVSTSEREWLQAWVARLGLDERVRCYPGADEISAASLVGAVIRSGAGERRARVLCVEPEGLRRIAPFEDVPLADTLAEHARTAGVRLIEDGTEDADFVIAVHVPSDSGGDWFREAGEAAEQEETRSSARELARGIRAAIDAGERVVVADVAFANGADPALVRALGLDGTLARLSGFAGWNTAGNSIGTALAIGGALAVNPDPDPVAMRRLLAERLIEDWGYQSSVRPDLTRRWAGSIPTGGEEELETLLRECLLQLPELREEWSIADGSAHWPWGRLFEVAFQLNRNDGAAR